MKVVTAVGRKTFVYLKRAQELGIIPNFWLSADYLRAAGVTEERDGDLVWIQDGEWTVFPPLSLSLGLDDLDALVQRCKGLRSGWKIWSDFQNYHLGVAEKFLDWEYVYDPLGFSWLVGGKWETFRKNIRKWPRGRKWSYGVEATRRDVEQLLLSWLEGRADEEIHDSDVMLWFVFHGAYRRYVYDADRLVGMNVWDANGAYVMYRYCITLPGEPFLNEFARWLFYVTDVPSHCLVIDGGTLGKPSLERFKDKLNPLLKRPVYSRTL